MKRTKKQQQAAANQTVSCMKARDTHKARYEEGTTLRQHFVVLIYFFFCKK